MATDALVLKQYPQCCLKSHYIGPVSHISITCMMNSIEKKIMSLKNDAVVKSWCLKGYWCHLHLFVCLFMHLSVCLQCLMQKIIANYFMHHLILPNTLRKWFWFGWHLGCQLRFELLEWLPNHWKLLQIMSYDMYLYYIHIYIIYISTILFVRFGLHFFPTRWNNSISLEANFIPDFIHWFIEAKEEVYIAFKQHCCH